MPKISIVLPTYNGAKFIRDSIDSVLSQTEADWELIIVNDGSKDGTLEICEEYVRLDKRINLINNVENKKLPASLNVGFSNSTGRYLTWTSDDNLYKPDALKVMAAFLDVTPDVGLVCCENDVINEDGSFLRVRDNAKGWDKPYFLLADCNVGACFMYRRQVYEVVGDYNTDFFCAEDYDYWFRVAIASNISYIKVNQYKYRVNNSSLTATKSEIIRNKTKEIRNKYLPIFLDKFDIPRNEMAYIYYLMWRNDMSNWRLIGSAAINKPTYLVRAFLHWQKMMRRRLSKSMRPSQLSA